MIRDLPPLTPTPPLEPLLITRRRDCLKGAKDPDVGCKTPLKNSSALSWVKKYNYLNSVMGSQCFQIGVRVMGSWFLNEVIPFLSIQLVTKYWPIFMSMEKKKVILVKFGSLQVGFTFCTWPHHTRCISVRSRNSSCLVSEKTWLWFPSKASRFFLMPLFISK